MHFMELLWGCVNWGSTYHQGLVPNKCFRRVCYDCTRHCLSRDRELEQFPFHQAYSSVEEDTFIATKKGKDDESK